MDSDQATSEPKRVPAASFTWCFEESCPFSDSTHLLVSKFHVPLQNGNAVAISYTWGEFDRREVPLGHDESGRKVSIVLGCEWHAPDVINKLVAMGYDLTSTETAMPFWMDQLCIPQDDEAIRATLPSIPLIFNTFDTVALLPGSPCKCLRESLEEHGTHQSPNLTQAQLDRMSMDWAEKMGLCVNSTSFCSYFERVWTRQEMLYTRKMHVEWTGSEVSRCVLPSAGGKDITFGLMWMDDEEEGLGQTEETAMEAERDLAPFARQVYQRALSTNITHTHALARVKMKHDKAWHNAVLAFDDFLSKSVARTHSRYYAIRALCQFLLGIPLQLIHEDSEGPIVSDAQKLRKFGSRLSGVGWVQRSATKPRDYVLAVWIDCPKYVVPKEYGSMSLPHLLEDAILQLERNFKVTVPVTALAGLFGCPRPSVFWRPALYLPEIVPHTQHVYGTVVAERSLLPIASPEGLSLNVYNPRIGRAKTRTTFSEFARGKTAAQILELVHHIVMRWPPATLERITSVRKTEFRDQQEGLGAAVKAIILMSHPLMKEAMSASLHQLQGMETLFEQMTLGMISGEMERFHDILFELVCEALGLNLPASPYRESLCLVVNPSEQPAIGICRQREPGLGTNSGGEETSSNRITVCRDFIGSGAGCTVLEAVKVSSEDEQMPHYMGIGVWVAQTVTPWQDVGSLTDETMQNALLI